MSDVGRVRRGNEDNYLLLDLATPRMWHRLDGDESPQEMRQFTLGEKGLVLVVSDGMGGALAGDVASKMAIEAVVPTHVGARNPAVTDKGVVYLAHSSVGGLTDLVVVTPQK